MKTVYFFFGEMGAGKSFCAQRFAQKIDAHFVEGDLLLPKKLQQKCKRLAVLTREEVRSFVDGLPQQLVEVAASMTTDKPLVVAQALYNNQDRLDLAQAMREKGWDPIFVHIRVPLLRNIRQLWSRRNGLRWILVYLMCKRWFEQPTHYCAQMAPL